MRIFFVDLAWNDPEAIVEFLYPKLQNLPRSGTGFGHIKSTVDSIEKLLQQLEAQGKVSGTQCTLIMCNFPIEVVIKPKSQLSYGP